MEFGTREQILTDPQELYTKRLLAAVPGGQADLCLATLQAKGYAQSRIVGCVIPRVEGVKPVAIATI